MYEKIVDNLVKWLQNSVKEANCKRWFTVLAVELILLLWRDFVNLLFGDNALAVIMPINSLESDETDARLVADKFSLNVEKVDLSNIFSEMKNIFEKGRPNSMAYANIKPRLR